MARIDNLTNFLTDVADSIRNKKETQEKISPADFDTEISTIETGVDTSDATATANDILSNKTAYADGVKLTGTIPTKSQTITPSTERQSIDQGYHVGSYVEGVTKDVDSNIVASNIKSGVSILGVTGNVTELNAQEKEATPTTSEQVITPNSSYNALSKVTIAAVDNTIDSNIKSSNIKSGVTILGVEGNVEPDKPDQTKTVDPSTSSQTVTPDIGYELSSVTVNPVTSSIDSNIAASNIKQGVSILGVDGTVEELNGQTKTVSPSTSSQTITPDSNYNALTEVTVNAVTSSIDNNIQAGNIKQGTTILGVTGSVVELNGETKTITPSTSVQVVTPTSGKNAITEVTVEAVDNTIDSNIVSGNIKSGVTILGVSGDSNVVDTSDATVRFSNRIASGETAYVKGQKITGTATKFTTSKNPAKMARADKDYNGDDISQSKALSNISLSETDIGFMSAKMADDSGGFGVAGLWSTGVYTSVATKQSLLATKLDLTADKLVSGNTILGVSGSAVELQGETKTVTPTTSQQTITPSSGKNGITEVTVEAVDNTIDSNITSGNIKSGVTILGVSGTYEGVQPSGTYDIYNNGTYDVASYQYVDVNVSGYPPNWSEIGYYETPAAILDGFAYAQQILTNWNEYDGYLYGKFYNDPSLIYLPSLIVDITANCTNIDEFCKGCTELQAIGELSIPFDGSNGGSTQEAFRDCARLVSIGFLDIGPITNANNMFEWCPNLNDDALDKIMYMLYVGTSPNYTGQKTLRAIGFNNDQIARCRNQASYQDLMNAGWTET